MPSVAEGVAAEGRGGHTSSHVLVGRRGRHGRLVRVSAVLAVLAEGAAFLNTDFADDISWRFGRVRFRALDACLEHTAAAARFEKGARLGGRVDRLPDHLQEEG